MKNLIFSQIKKKKKKLIKKGYFFRFVVICFNVFFFIN